MSVFEEIADGTGTYSPNQQRIFQYAGEGHYLGTGQLAPNGLGCCHTIHHRHHQIHKHNIWLELPGHAQRLLPVSCFAGHHLQLGVQSEKHAQSLADNIVVVCNQDTNCHGLSAF
jgi:hypothetical protein